MGELSNTLDEFQEISREYYQKIMSILGDKYCWKCPMRTNRKETLCQEVESWIRLTEALENGVREELILRDFSMEKMEILAPKFLEKKMKSPDKTKDSLILKLDEDINLNKNEEPLAKSGDFLFIKTNTHIVNKDDLILLPRACPLATYWYIKTAKKAIVPFKIFKVSRVFHNKGCRYIQTTDGLEIPLVYVIGVVKNIISQDLSIQSWD